MIESKCGVSSKYLKSHVATSAGLDVITRDVDFGIVKLLPFRNRPEVWIG